MKNLKQPKRFFAKCISKKIIYCFLTLLTHFLAQAQSPNQFSYQGIARGTDGKIIQGSVIKIKLTIYEKLPSDAEPTTQVFQEIQNVQTNDFGVFNVAIGSVASGLELIDWQDASKAFFLGIQFDPSGGNAFVDLGKTQLLHVPYAMFAQESGRLSNYKPLILKGTYGTNIEPPALPSPAVGEGERLLWHPTKAAFRAGFQTSSLWYNANLGKCSFAVGSESNAYADYSSALGQNSYASGEGSVAAGLFAQSQGKGATAIGDHVISKSPSSVALGSFNDANDLYHNSAFPEDRIFQIGIGPSENYRANALTILRTGNMGIGSNVLKPEYLLDLGARARIRHNPGATAGIHFNNSQNNVDGFVGMRADGEVGFYVGNNWGFWVNAQGDGYFKGNVNQTSDKRLKESITPFEKGDINNLYKLSGYHFRWKEKSRGTDLQTGLIAQEVEAYFPELVKTDAAGFKSVNYIGMVPHLIESVKALNEKAEEIAMLRRELDKFQSLSSRLEKVEEALNLPTAHDTAEQNLSEVR